MKIPSVSHIADSIATNKQSFSFDLFFPLWDDIPIAECEFSVHFKSLHF